MKNREITLTAILMTILMICSQISLPIGPIPFTLQTLAVLMIGYFLSPKTAVLVTTIYLVAGVFGLPIFTNFMGGFQAVLLPSFGFILGFIPATYFQAKYLEKHRNLWIAGIINFLITYLIGLTYMALILNMYLGSGLTITGILMTGLIPFIPMDIAKIIVAVLLVKRLLPIVRRNGHAI